MVRVRFIRDVEAEVWDKGKTKILAGTVLTVEDDEATNLVLKGIAEVLGNAQNEPSQQGGLARKPSQAT